MTDKKHILVTGGAGFIGSLLTGELLRTGYSVTVVDDLLFGGESLMAYFPNENFNFVKANVWEPRTLQSALRSDFPTPSGIVHLAGIVGFPACQAVGREVAWRYNVEATQRMFDQANEAGIPRFIFPSTYSNYDLAEDNKPVTEASPLNPQSLYAETKIAAEEYLTEQANGSTAPLIFRFATLFGTSPRTRFDLIVNQFVLEAYTRRALLIYQRGYSRSFVHVRDTVRGIIMGLEAPEEKIRGQILNLGTDDGNHSKDEIVALILKRLPETYVQYKDLSFGGDRRDITVSFKKIRRVLDYRVNYSVEDGVREVLHMLRNGVIKDPEDNRYRNAQFIVQ